MSDHSGRSRSRRRRDRESDPFDLPPLLGQDGSDEAPEPWPPPAPTRGEGWVRLDEPHPATHAASDAGSPYPSRRAARRHQEQAQQPPGGPPGSPAGGSAVQYGSQTGNRTGSQTGSRAGGPPGQVPGQFPPPGATGPNAGVSGLTDERDGGAGGSDPHWPSDLHGPGDLRTPGPDGLRPHDPDGFPRQEAGRTGIPGAPPGPDGTPLPGQPAEARSRRGPALPLVALLLLGWVGTSLLAVQRPALLGLVLVVLATTCPLASVFAAPVFALALRRRRWISLGLAAAAALAPWAYLLGYAAPAPSHRIGTQALRVLAVNAHAGGANAADIVALAREQAADVLVVTEASGLLVHDLTVDGIDATLKPVSVSMAGPVEAGLAIYSRFPVTGLAPVPGTRWPAVKGLLDTGHGTITLIAGHVVPPGRSTTPTWADDLHALGRAAAVPGPVLVVGSLNGTPWNAQFRAISSGPLHDAAALLGRGLRPSWPSWLPFPLIPLDHALVGGGVGVTSVGTAPIGGTDHRALIVALTVPQR